MEVPANWREILKSNYSNLFEKMDSEHELIGELDKLDLFTPIAINNLRDTTDPGVRNTMILDHVTKGNNARFEKFLLALKNNEQEWLIEEYLTKVREMPVPVCTSPARCEMIEELKLKNLKEHFVYLKEKINPGPSLISRLHGVFLDTQIRQLQSIVYDMKRNELMLRWLQRGSNGMHTEFCTALRQTDQGHLVDNRLLKRQEQLPETPRAALEPPRAGAESPLDGAGSPRARTETPQAGTAPPRAGAEPPRAGLAPPRAGAEPPRAGAEAPWSGALPTQSSAVHDMTLAVGDLSLHSTAMPTAIQIPADWTNVKTLGQGSFGVVYLGAYKDGGIEHFFAVKQTAFNRSDHIALKAVEQLRNEIDMLQKLDGHARIVKYFGSREIDDALVIFMEYVPGGSVANYIGIKGPLNEAQTRLFSSQILEGLAYLHGKHITHRDVKGANILLADDSHVKLTDFGLSKQLQSTATHSQQTHSFCGSNFYMAPEVIRATESNGYGRKSDIWSFGCTVVEMLTGKHLYPEATPQNYIWEIGNGKEVKYDLPDATTLKAQQFLKCCFYHNPNERSSAEDLLKHPFVRSGDMSASLC